MLQTNRATMSIPTKNRPSLEEYERKMKVGNILLRKQDERTQPLLASNLSSKPPKMFQIGGFVESASEMSSQAPADLESRQSSPMEK